MAPIIITILAIWGAVLSTIGILVQIRAHYKNKGALRVSAEFGGVRSEGFFVYFSITNIGRRPVTVLDVRATFPRRKLLGDLSLPLERLPVILNEGEIYYGEMSLSKLEHLVDENFNGIHALDSLGREWNVSSKSIDDLITRRHFHAHIEKELSLNSFVGPFNRKPKFLWRWWRAFWRWARR